MNAEKYDADYESNDDQPLDLSLKGRKTFSTVTQGLGSRIGSYRINRNG